MTAHRVVSGVVKLSRPDRLRFVHYVYFVLEEGDRFVKIGETWNPASRLRSLQTANARELKLVALIRMTGPLADDRARRLEGDLHCEFRADHVRGEWFRWSEPIASRVTNHATCATEYLEALTAI